MAAGELLFLLLTIFTLCDSFYIPGVAPSEFTEGSWLELKALSMTSVKTQLPYDYYSLPFCGPDDKNYKSLNLGEVLRGDRIVNTFYRFQLMKEVSCQILCETTLTAKQSNLFLQRIEQEYILHLYILKQ
jgi:transmembrane 9 superfamily protein 2/4